MPRLIDHTERERAIAEAAWRVLVRDGLLAMSVRNVSAEAGLATASLRRSFPTQAALRAFCLDLCAEGVTGRIQALDQTMPARDFLEACLWELLPFDERRRIELDVQLTLGTLVGTDPLVTESYRRSHAQLREWLRRLVEHLAASDARYGHLGRDLDLHAETLRALVDGLALHLWHEPASSRPDRIAEARAVIIGHLDALAELG